MDVHIIALLAKVNTIAGTQRLKVYTGNRLSLTLNVMRQRFTSLPWDKIMYNS